MNMITTAQQSKARTFLSLHDGSRLLVLPNIWNPIGARLLAAKGYPAIATASAAVSASLGYADGEKIKLETLLAILIRITKSVDLPVTADIESGYADSIEALKETIRRTIDAGVVGINLEDGLVEGGPLRAVDEQCGRITAVRETAAQMGLHLVINARVDSFLSGNFKSQEERIEDAIVRANRYKDAGADCIYPIGPGDRQTITVLRKNITSPLNVLASSAAISLTELQELGINRVSFGPFIFRACLGKMSHIFDELKGFGSYDCFTKEAISRTEVAAFLIHDKE